MKYFLTQFILIVLVISVTEGISCYKHGICTTNEYCVLESNKVQCANSETFCFKNDIMFDVAERGCAESYTCNSSAPIARRHCCDTNYCNYGISSIQTNLSILFTSILIIYFILFF